MEKPVLIDANVYPTNEILFSHLGKVKIVYLSLFDYIHRTYPDFVENWKYYRDGNCWLLNVTRKKKALFWLSVSDGSFRTTFYLSSKYEKEIVKSNIPAELKQQFMGSSGKKIRGITIVLTTEKDIETFKELLSIKLSIK
ncbi:MAG: DUF3788 family protein [Candidatus Marinimicrobia bacterium]|nr:DUF3788 family protein [Candidatus Neomarinimicrobiota bacterium]